MSGHLERAARLFKLVADEWPRNDVDLDFPNGGYKPQEGRRYIALSLEQTGSRLVSLGPPRQFVYYGFVQAIIADIAGEGFGAARELADALDVIYFGPQGEPREHDNLDFYRGDDPREVGGNDTHTAFEYSARFELFFYVD